MRESNSAQSKACVCITSQLYNRRFLKSVSCKFWRHFTTLDTTVLLLLFNSLTHLTYRTSTLRRLGLTRRSYHVLSCTPPFTISPSTMSNSLLPSSSQVMRQIFYPHADPFARLKFDTHSIHFIYTLSPSRLILPLYPRRTPFDCRSSPWYNVYW